jgi:hypothetical protein
VDRGGGYTEQLTSAYDCVGQVAYAARERRMTLPLRLAPREPCTRSSASEQCAPFVLGPSSDIVAVMFRGHGVVGLHHLVVVLFAF